MADLFQTQNIGFEFVHFVCRPGGQTKWTKMHFVCAPGRTTAVTRWSLFHGTPESWTSLMNLQAHLTRFSGQYDKLLAFKPTGWTFSHGVEAVEDVRPKVQGNISIYGIPYSEHSSYLELRRFVQWIQPLKIIPTVNVGSWASRKAMERCFCEWLTEAKANNVKGIQKRTL